MVQDKSEMIKFIEGINHGCVKFKFNEKIIYTDPFAIDTAINDADVIFITHCHGDHFSLESIKNILKDSSIIIMPKYIENSNPKNINMVEEIKNSIENSKYREIIEVSPNETCQVEGIQFETIPSYNKNHPKENGWVGYTIVINENKFHITGDTGITEELLKINTDVLIFPIDGVFNMSALDGINLLKNMKKRPSIVIPYHFGHETFDTIFNLDTKKQGIVFDNEIRCLQEYNSAEFKGIKYYYKK